LRDHARAEIPELLNYGDERASVTAGWAYIVVGTCQDAGLLMRF